MNRILSWLISLAMCFTFSLSINMVEAATETVTVDAMGEYDVGGNDTREQAKNIALDNAKRHALEQVAISIESKSNTSMGKLTRDTIMSYASGRLRIIGNPVYNFLNDGMKCRAYIKATVNVDYEELKRERNRAVINPAPVQRPVYPSGNNGAYGGSNVGSGAKSKVLDGAIEYNGHYYKNFEMKMKWEPARRFCETMGGHLATMENAGEIAILDKLRQKGSNEYWIGGYSTEQGLWKWVTGGIITDSYWDKGHPYGSGDMYRMYIYKNSVDLLWRNSKHYYVYSFICEWESAADAHDSNM